MKPTSRQLKELIDNTNENEVTICRYIVERLDLEYTQLENKINKAIELLGNYKHYSTPDEKQNGDNEDLVNNAFDILKEVSK